MHFLKIQNYFLGHPPCKDTVRLLLKLKTPEEDLDLKKRDKWVQEVKVLTPTSLEQDLKCKRSNQALSLGDISQKKEYIFSK